MGRRSIRFEMTFWYSVTMAITLVIVGVAFERLAYNRISASIDASLRRGAYTVINEISRLSGELHEIPSDSLTSILNPTPWPPWYVQLLDADLNVVHTSRNLGPYHLPVDTALVRGVGRGFTVAPDMKLQDSERIRIISFRLPSVDGSPVGWGQVGLSLHDLNRARRKNQLALFFIIPTAIGVSTLVGAWLTRRALQPIDDVTRSAMRIRVANLDERIEPREVDDELGRLIDTLNGLFERLDKSFQQISRFSADVSHELRTPLTIIQGEAEVALRKGATVEEKTQAIEVILDEARRMSQLVRNLLTLAQLETGQRKPELTRLSLRPILEDLVEEAHVMAAKKDITLNVNLQGNADVIGDAVLLHQLGVNLIDNAVKYTPEGGEVELVFETELGSARITVRDSGIGIEADEIEHIFDRFYRSDKARSHSDGGSGLGLSLVKQIVETHSGTITVHSKPGDGSEFVVTLPTQSRSYAARSGEKSPAAERTTI